MSSIGSSPPAKAMPEPVAIARMMIEFKTRLFTIPCVMGGGLVFQISRDFSKQQGIKPHLAGRLP